MENVTMRQEQAASTRKKLLESATKIFAEKGYEGASVRAINSNVNLANGLLYHYFPGGKKELFKAVIEENRNKIFLAIEQLKNEIYIELPLEEMLEKIYTGFVDLIDAHLDILRMFFREKEVLECISNEQIMQVIGTRDPWIGDMLKQKYLTGEIREMDFEMAGMQIASILINHAMIKMVTDCKSILEIPEARNRVIDYQVSMWLA